MFIAVPLAGPVGGGDLKTVLATNQAWHTVPLSPVERKPWNLGIELGYGGSKSGGSPSHHRFQYKVIVISDNWMMQRGYPY